MSYMLSQMIDRYPNVDIYFILNTDLKEKCDDAVRAICKHYKMSCVELRDIDKKSGHPSVAGMAQINGQINNFIQASLYNIF